MFENLFLALRTDPRHFVEDGRGHSTVKYPFYSIYGYETPIRSDAEWCRVVGKPNGLTLDTCLLYTSHAVHADAHVRAVVDETQHLHIIADAEVRAHFVFSMSPAETVKMICLLDTSIDDSLTLISPKMCIRDRYGSNGALFRGGDAFLQGAHFRGQRGLVTHGAGRCV